MKRIRSLLCCAFALVAASAAAEPAMVRGSVWLRQRIALPPGYVVRVEMRDVSRQDAAAEDIASVEMRPEGQLPIPYVLHYDTRRIEPSHIYSVSARVLVGGRLAFVSTRINPVVTMGRPNVADILLQQVGGPR